MKHKLGISLSGGGARGIAHIGVLQALEENNIYPEAISGASAGSIVGSLYAAGKTPQEILSIFQNSSLLKLFKFSIPTVGLTDISYIKEILAEHIPQDNFVSLEKELFISVTNLSRGEYEIRQQGELFEAVATSSSIPILFKSRTQNGDLYADGGLLNNLPVEPLRERCKYVIGVNVTPILYESDLSNLVRIGYRALDLVMWSNVEPRLQQCDLVIQPAADTYGFFDIHKTEEIFNLGYESAMESMPEIIRKLKGRYILPVRFRPAPETQSNRSRRPSLFQRLKDWGYYLWRKFFGKK